jgi:hypothetical protein
MNKCARRGKKQPENQAFWPADLKVSSPGGVQILPAAGHIEAAVASRIIVDEKSAQHSLIPPRKFSMSEITCRLTNIPPIEFKGLVGGSCAQIAAGGNGVWAIDATGEIFRFEDYYFLQVPGTVTQIAVGYGAGVWGVDASHHVYAFVRP